MAGLPEQQSRSRYVQPFTCILHNLPVRYDQNGKGLNPDYGWLRPLLHDCGFTAVRKVYPVSTKRQGFIGLAFIEFDEANCHDSFRQARKLEARFAAEDAGRISFYSDARQKGPYLWVATHVDHHLLTHYKRQHILATVAMSWEREAIPPAAPGGDEASIFDMIYTEIHEEYPNTSSDSNN
jgi:hypothetical protein